MDQNINQNVESVQAEALVGSFKAGKTEALLSRVATWINEGCESIAVFCASPFAAHEFERRLIAHLEATGRNASAAAACVQHVTIGTPYELALKLLQSDFAQEVFGRTWRIATPWEEACLFEDVKVTGVRPKRLREILRFFERAWSELAEGDEWLVTDEERLVHAAAKQSLDFMGVVIKHDAAAKACAVLASSALAREAFSFSCVAIDDLNLMNRASQALAECMALSELVITYNPDDFVPTFDAYPYGAALLDIEARAKSLSVTELVSLHERATTRAAKRLISDASRLEKLSQNDVFDVEAFFDSARSEDEARLPVQGFSGLEFEEDAVIAFARERICGNADKKVAIVVPDAQSVERFVSACKEAELDATSQPLVGSAPLNSAIAQAVALLALYVDKTDLGAWRSWCASTDYLGASLAFSELHQRAVQKGCTAREVFENLKNEEASLPTSLLPIVEAKQKGIKALERLSKAGQHNLLRNIATEAVAASDAPEEGVEDTIDAVYAHLKEMAALACPDGDMSDASSVWRAVLAGVTGLIPAGNPAPVVVVEAHHVAGLDVSSLAVIGLNAGAYPSRDVFDPACAMPHRRARTCAKSACVLAGVLGRASDDVLLTYLEECPLSYAEQHKLKIARVKLKKGERVCKLSKTILL